MAKAFDIRPAPHPHPTRIGTRITLFPYLFSVILYKSRIDYGKAMRVMRVNRTYLASPKRASITFFFFCRKRKKRNVLSMTDLKPTRTRITHTTRTRHVGTMSPDKTCRRRWAYCTSPVHEAAPTAQAPRGTITKEARAGACDVPLPSPLPGLVHSRFLLLRLLKY